MRRKLLKNVFSLSVSEIAGRLLAFSLTVYVARQFGSEMFGQLSFAQAIATYFTLFVNFGLNIVGIREIASSSVGQSKKIVSAVIKSKLILFSASLLLLICLLLFNDMDGRMVLLLTVTVMAGILSALLDMSWVFNGHSMMHYTGILRVIQQLSYFVIAVILLNVVQRVYALPLASGIGAMVTGVIAFILLSRVLELQVGGLLKEPVSRGLRKDLLRSGLVVFVSSMMTQIYYNFDTIVLKTYHGDHLVGLYNAGYKIIMLLVAFPSIIITVLFPLFSKAAVKDGEKSGQYLRNSLAFMFLVVSPIVVGGQLLGSQIIDMLFGPAYSEASNSFKILLCALLFIFLNYVLGHFLLSIRKEKVYSLFVVIGACSNITLNFIFIPEYGLPAAAIITVFAEFVVFTGYFFYLWRNGQLSLGRVKFVRFIAVMAVFALCIQLIGQHFHILFSISAGAVIYTALIVVFRLVDTSSILQQILKKSQASKDEE